MQRAIGGEAWWFDIKECLFGSRAFGLTQKGKESRLMFGDQSEVSEIRH